MITISLFTKRFLISMSEPHYRVSYDRESLDILLVFISYHSLAILNLLDDLNIILFV